MTDQLQRDAEGRAVYTFRGVQLCAFMGSTAAVQVIQGPVGSGKSKGCNLKVWSLANQQRHGPDGLRHSRWGVVRNTYPELRSTTIRTWVDTFPEEIYGPVVWSMPARQIMRVADVVLEIDFLALDKPEDVKKVRSGEYTGFYVNELQYLPKELFDEMTSRAGRFPAMKDGGPSWHGVIADMNAPDEDHFIAMMTGQTDYPENTPEDDRIPFPPEWDFFMQPPGLLEIRGPDGKTVVSYPPNPRAENVEWLPKDYYPAQIKGKSRAWIKSRVLNQIALVVDGEAVWPGFRVDTHVAGEVLKAIPGHDIWIGLDFGRQPAAVFGQTVNNRINVLAEMQAFGEGAVTFAPKVKRFLEQRFGGFSFRAYGDPKGQDKGQTDERTAYDVFKFNGIPVTPAPVKGNSIETRIQAVESVLDQNYMGRPRFQVSPACRSLKVGMEGRYCFKRKQASTETHTEPDKNRYSHLADALQYMVLGMGEGRAMMGLTAANVSRGVQVYKGRKSMRRVEA